jgi:hypothetical protein
MRTITSHALSHGAGESFQRPNSYAGFLVGSYIGAKNGSERRAYSISASKRLSS